MSGKAKRKLAAIMFTDIAGYTALMQENEQRAKAIRDLHRNVLQEKIGGHDGKILQYYGDGTLSIFDSSLEAVRAAIDIQTVLRNEDQIIPLRIGIHAGDIVHDDEGAYGDGVNVASRVESVAIPGAVLLSEKVFDDVKGHPHIHYRFLGVYQLKNVHQPLGVYAVEEDKLVLPHPNEIRGNLQESGQSIAVLPFVNMSSDPESEYFSDGITEEILNALAKIKGLKVISRTSAFAFKNTTQDIRDIAKALNVQTVLEGSVRLAQNKVRIAAQLIDGKDGFHLWSEIYKRELEDLFEVQEEISQNIATALSLQLLPNKVKEHQTSTPTDNIEAYNLYLKGLFLWNRLTPKEIPAAISCFEKALELEPDFAQAYARLADCYIFLGSTSQEGALKCYQKAYQYAQKALKLDPHNVEAFLALASYYVFNEWNIIEARKNLEQAYSLDHQNGDVQYYATLINLVTGELEAALGNISVAMSFDPLSLTYRRAFADTLYFMRSYERAIEQYKYVEELDKNSNSATEFMGWAYLMNGQVEEAIAIFENLGDVPDYALQKASQLGYAYSKGGNEKRAREMFERLKQFKAHNPELSLAVDFAMLHTALGEYDEAFHYIEKGIDERLGSFSFLKVSPIWEPIKGDPRFEAMLKKLHLG